MDVKEIFTTNEDFHEYVLRYIRNNGKTIEQALRENIVKDMAEYYVKESAKNSQPK